MSLIAEFPYNEFYIYNPVWHKKQKRWYIMLRNINTGKAKTVSLARYKMSIYLKRFLEKDETVDHINNDKSDDRIENLQILSQQENYKKYIRIRQTNRVPIMQDLICPYCYKKFQLTKRRYNYKKKNNKNIFCSNRCSGKFYWKYENLNSKESIEKRVKSRKK